MFENTTNFDFDDEILSNSFAPVKSSTQCCSSSPNTSNSPESNTTNAQNNNSTPPKCGNNTKILKRKFPGPAGLLLDRNEAKKMFTEEINKQNITLTQFLSTESALTYAGPWEEMKRDLNDNSLTETFNISWIKRQARSNKLLNQKSPFLAGIVQNIEVVDSKTPTVNVTLKDTTAQIHGTITYDLYKKYSTFLVTGTVLVLTYLGVLTTGFDSHYLIILPENLCCIYYVKNEGNVQKFEIKKVDSDEILREYKRNASVGNKPENVENKLKISRDNVKMSQSEELLNNLLDGVDIDSLLGDF